MSMNHPSIVLLSELLAIPSPPGREEKTAAWVRTKLDAMGFVHETDGAGNVFVRLVGKLSDEPTVIYAAHMDEIGMVVTAVEEDGTLKVNRSGGLYPWKIGERPVDVMGDFDVVPGILSMGSVHSPAVRDRKHTWGEVRIITGLSQDAMEQAGIRVGSSAVPSTKERGPILLGDGPDPLVAAWTFDDRIDVVNLLRLLERVKAESIQPVRNTIVAFTVHEEAGCHGAKVLAQREKAELFVAVDGLPVLEENDLELDGKAGIWSKDALTHFDQEVIKAFRAAARAAGTELKTAVFEGAASDASSAYSVGAVDRVATVGHIRDNSHGYEVSRLSSFDNALETLIQFLKTWG
ncbi:MAG: M20/M25/M40 family metallo-hydrolase [Planctomycetota bacterium]|jgi:putative aminopeptidase FrvX